MKKVSKCLLIVTTVISLVCLVFYKTQYDKLHNVLQVLELFGRPDEGGGRSSGCGPFDPAVWRPPSWQSFFFFSAVSGGKELHTYSAFCFQSGSSGDCAMIKVLAVAQRFFPFANVSCRIWYEDTLRPVVSVFNQERFIHMEDEEKMSGHQKNWSMAAYLLSCENKFPSLKPLGVSLLIQDDRDPGSELYVSVHHPESAAPAPDLYSAAACVRPQSDPHDVSQTLMENLLLHGYFGVKQFVLYDAGLSHKLMSSLSNVSSTAKWSSFRIRILPWNLARSVIGQLPESEHRALIDTDCSLRLKGTVATHFVVSSGQIVVPKLAATIPRALHDAHLRGALHLTERTFCLESEANADSLTKHKHLITPLMQTSFIKSGMASSSSRFFLRHQLRSSDTDVNTVPADVMAVHHYTHCGLANLDQNPEEDDDDTLSRMASSIDHEIGSFFPVNTNHRSSS